MRLATTFAVLLLAGTTEAQVVIQQPVVSQFGVSTSVSVPDRGTALLGGVSTYRASRGRYGFWPRVGSSYGREIGHSNITATVQIHDLRAMDEYLLGQGGGLHPSEAPATTARGLLGGHRDRAVAARPRASTDVATNAGRVAKSDRGRRSYELGLRAERAGSVGLAKLHYEMAARHGSIEAWERLQRNRLAAP